MIQELNRNTKIWLTVARVMLGWLFFYAGLVKILNANWSAAGFLNNAKTFPGLYAWFAGPSVIGVVNFINEWALLLLGISLILGLFVRWSAIPGALLMALYYFAGNAFPAVANGFIVDQHIVYIAILILFFVTDAGNYFGLDSKFSKSNRG
ncbi:MAG: DoxX family protein [Patescibacteria group bacterium]